MFALPGAHPWSCSQSFFLSHPPLSQAREPGTQPWPCGRVAGPHSCWAGGHLLSCAPGPAKRGAWGLGLSGLSWRKGLSQKHAGGHKNERVPLVLIALSATLGGFQGDEKLGNQVEPRCHSGTKEGGKGAQDRMVWEPSPLSLRPEVGGLGAELAALGTASPLQAGQAFVLQGPGVLNACHKMVEMLGIGGSGLEAIAVSLSVGAFPFPARALLGVGGLPGCKDVLVRQPWSNPGRAGAPRRPQSPRF